MKSRIILIICAAVITGYFAYGQFFKEKGISDEGNVRISFQAMSLAVATNNKNAVKAMISPSFSDRKVTSDDLSKILTMKRGSYSSKIRTITTQGDLASIFYIRTESRGPEDSPPFTVNIKGETWGRDKNNPKVWKLVKLAANDKWFRTMDYPMPKKAIASKKNKRVLGSLEDGASGSSSMKKGGYYSSVGKRDPFRSLIALDMGPEPDSKDICDPDRPRELLENYDLLSLKLSGVIESASGPVALIEAPDGKGFTVSPGMYLGKRCGKVLGIERNFVVVKEQVPKIGAGIGVYESVETALKLRPEEG